MRIISRLKSQEQYYGQCIFLMECGNHHQFEMDDLLKKNCKVFNQKDAYGRNIPGDTIPVCPICGDDDQEIEQLNIC